MVIGAFFGWVFVHLVFFGVKFYQSLVQFFDVQANKLKLNFFMIKNKAMRDLCYLILIHFYFELVAQLDIIH